MSAISTLVSKLNVDKGLSNITSTNIANADVEGYARKEAQAYTASEAGELGGVRLSGVYNTIDSVLLYHTRKENSILSRFQARDEFYKRVNLLFGSKGSEGSYVHNLGDYVSSMYNTIADPSAVNKKSVIDNAVVFAQQLSNMAVSINDFRGSADASLAEAIDSFNELVDKIAVLNQKISGLSSSPTGGPDGGFYVDITSFENERDLYVQQLSGLADINVYKTPNNKLNISLVGNGQTIVQGSNSYHLDYNPSSSVAPGQVLSPINYLGVDITTQIQGGRIAGLVEVRDTVLTDMQAELDELTRVVRDTVNAAHNEGTAFNGGATLTGTDSVPGVVGPITGATAVSGLGTLRIAVLNNEGTVIDYKDVTLANGMTVGGLVAAINGTNYVLGAGAAPIVPGGALTVTQLPSGALQVQSTAGNTIAIGSVGAPTAKMSLGAAYDPTTGLGFSHFFGLNNFFTTGTSLASSAAQVGIANQLEVRSDLPTNPSHFSVGALNSEAVMPTGVGGGLAYETTDIADRIASQLRAGSLSFLAAGPLDAVDMNAEAYGARIMAAIQGEVNQADQDVKLYQASYNKFTQLAAEKGSVDPAEELVKIYNISSSQAITTKALSLVLEMQKAIVNLI